MKRAWLACLLAAGCATPAASDRTAPGLFHEYVRSNRDGTLPETIWIYLPSADAVEVVKIVARCTDAAYVTARLRPDGATARSLVAGRLARDGSQRVTGRMRHDAAAGEIRYRIGEDPVLEGALAGVTGEWHLFDYDFATLIAAAHGAWPAGGARRFELIRLMPDATGALTFDTLGIVTLRPAQTVEGVTDYHVGGGGLPEGVLRRDAATGTVLEIASSAKNHAEYRDFRLKHIRSARITREQWRARRASHWTDCAE